MRQLILILMLLGGAIFALSQWQPGAADVIAPTPTGTLLPDDFTLIPPFVPSYPCELQQVDVYDEALCRSETVSETVLAQGEGVSFIRHDYHTGQGCWGSVSQDIHELHVCQRDSGVTSLLTNELTSDLILSPNGEWYAFGTLSMVNALQPHVYRVRVDGTDVQQLDSGGFPAAAVGAPGDLRWLDDEWLALTLWEGREGQYPAYRLKADGSGIYQQQPS